MKPYWMKATFFVALPFNVPLSAAQNSDSELQPHHQAVRIREVVSLELLHGKLTTGRRAAPVPQLTCTGQHCDSGPTHVRCTNAGFDGRDAQWDCKAALPESLRFGRLRVQCEGYDHRDDEHILEGSCGLQYTLRSAGSGAGDDEECGGSGVLALLVVLCLLGSCCADASSPADRSDFGTGLGAAAIGASAAGAWGSGGRRRGGGVHFSTGFASTGRR